MSCHKSLCGVVVYSTVAGREALHCSQLCAVLNKILIDCRTQCMNKATLVVIVVVVLCCVVLCLLFHDYWDYCHYRCICSCYCMSCFCCGYILTTAFVTSSSNGYYSRNYADRPPRSHRHNSSFSAQHTRTIHYQQFRCGII